MAVAIRRWTQHKGDKKLRERCGRRQLHPVTHPQPHLSPRGKPVPSPHFFSGDACSGKSSHPHIVCTTVHPSSTSVSLRYHFAVSGAGSTDSSADPSDNLLSGYLYGFPSHRRNADTFTDPGRHTHSSKVAGAGAGITVGAELLEVVTPPNPSRALSPGVQPTSKCSCCASGRQPPPHTHTGASTARGVLLRLRTSQTCVPAKLCGSANPERGITRPGPSGEQRTKDPIATRRARPQPTRTARSHGHAGRTCRRPTASPQSPVAAPTPAPSPPPPAVCTRLPRTPASSTSANSYGHFTAAPRLRVPGATSAKACAPG